LLEAGDGGVDEPVMYSNVTACAWVVVGVE